jgi:hypothetical protein
MWMWNALTELFVVSAFWFDHGFTSAMLRIQGDAQLLKTLLVESLCEPLSQFQHSKSQDRTLIENDLQFQQASSTVATNSQSQ